MARPKMTAINKPNHGLNFYTMPQPTSLYTQTEIMSFAPLLFFVPRLQYLFIYLSNMPKMLLLVERIPHWQ